MKLIARILHEIIGYIAGIIILFSCGLCMVLIPLLLVEYRFNLLEFLFQLLKLIPYILAILAVLGILYGISILLEKYIYGYKYD